MAKIILRSLLALLVALQWTSPASAAVGVSAGNSAHISQLQLLGNAVAANPSGTFALFQPYDAAADGSYLRTVVPTTFTGTFDCGNFPIKNIAIVNNDGLPTLPAASSISFFNKIDGGTLQNCTMQGSVAQTSTSLDGTLQTYRVAGIAGYLNNATISNVSANFVITANGYFNYDAPMFADVKGTSALDHLDCQGSVSISVTANNNVVGGCIASFFQGTLDTMRVHDMSLFAATGSSSGHTQQCSTPPCPTSGAYMGGAIGVPGYSGSQCVTVENVTVENTVTVQNTTNDGQGETGGVTGPAYCAVIHDSSSAATVSGSRVVAGVTSSLRYAFGATPTTEVYNVWNTGNITCTIVQCGGIVGFNSGYLHDAYSTGNITATLANSAAVAIGYNYAGGKYDHLFGWGTVTVKSAGGGTVGRNNVTAGAGDQAYTLSSIQGGTQLGGGMGVCANLGVVTNLYWDTTTSNLANGCGSGTAGSSITGLTDTQLLAGLPTGFDGAWAQDTNSGGYPYLAALPPPAAPPPPKPRKYLVLRPSDNPSSPIDLSVAAPDFNCLNNKAYIYGAGGNGGTANTGTGAGGGGGGGGYAQINNYCPATPSTPVAFSIAAGGSGTGTSSFWESTAKLKAASGANGAPGANGLGGAATSGVGTVRFGGANGGAEGSGTRSGGGGGGAAGPDGAGAVGGSGAGSATQGAGGGGGGADGGSAGVAGTTLGVGGNGGASFDPTPPITATFTASITGTTLSTSGTVTGTIVVGAVVTGVSVPANETIVANVNATDWLVSIGPGSPISSESMASATASGATPGGAGSSVPATPGSPGSNGSGGGGSSASTSTAGAGGAGSSVSTVAGVGAGSGGGGAAGLAATLTTGGNGGAGGTCGGGGGGGGRGITTGGTGGTGGDSCFVIEWTPQ